uniref:Protein FAR1-RELATED SEQUENCE n=1 Tax=Oryza glumipatula TaxID=40148 RepID=A0A0D9ZB84_9ORYZ
MEFDDEEDAWTFYNVYAHRVGFSTRISVMHRSRRDGSIMSRQFVCAKEGFRTYRGKNEVSPVAAGSGEDSGRGRRTRAVTRVGCKAMIRVKKQDNGRWAVTKLETAHNHPLVPPNQAHCLRPHKPLSECGKQRQFGIPRNGGMLLAIEPPPPPISPPVPQTSELVNCINMPETIDEFEVNFKALISKVGPGNSEWLYSVYNCRQHWVPVYLRDTFFGDESSKEDLCREALRYAEEGASSVEVYIVAMQALQEAANKVNMAKRGIGQVAPNAPLAVMPIAAQLPAEGFRNVPEISFNQRKKRKRNSNNKTTENSSNQLMYLQQPVNFLFVAPGTSSGPQGPSQIVAAVPVSSSAPHGQTSSANHPSDGNTTSCSVAAQKNSDLSNYSGSAPSLGNVVPEGEIKSSGFASQIKESHELSQGNGNKGNNVNMASSTSSPQLVTVPVGLCLPSMDSSKISADAINSTNSGSMISNGNVSFGLCQSQSTNADPWSTPEGSSIRAAAIAAGARIASPSDAASIIKAAQSKGAIHIRPGEGVPNYLKPLAPQPLSSLPPGSIPNSVHPSSSHAQPGQCSFGDSAAAKDAIFGSTDSSDDDEYDEDDDTDDNDEDEGITGDEVEQE